MANKENDKQLTCCRNCGQEIVNEDKRRRIFCSYECNRKWWSEHRDQVNRKSQITIICKNCNTSFKAYYADDRQYCSRRCMILYHRRTNPSWIEKEKALKGQIIVVYALLKKLIDEYKEQFGQ